ncbi:MAG: hypothetical protein ACFFDN_26915 [Candidatus Hodarchaeota archaeon]
MSIKSNAYLTNLKLHLGVNSLNEITEDHAKEILKYIKKHDDPEVLKELMKIMPDFFSFAKEANKNLNKTYHDIVKAGISDVNALKEIIMQLNKELDNNNLTEKDKDRIFDLIKEFQNILKKIIVDNTTIRKMIIAGAFLSTTMLGGLIIYKAFGGKGGEEAFAKASEKLIEQNI